MEANDLGRRSEQDTNLKQRDQVTVIVSDSSESSWVPGGSGISARPLSVH